jgi:2'-5' RNA ligase
MRLFISVDLPKKVEEQIIRLQSKLPEFVGKKTEPGNLHLTLKFIGDAGIEKIGIIKEKLSKIKLKKFNAEIDSIGIFSKSFIKIVWLHVSNCDDLQKEIDNSLEGLFPKEERFMSHLTIARVKKIPNKDEFLRQIKIVEVPKIKFEVNKFSLNQSILRTEGPKYNSLAEFNLEDK